MEEGYPGETLPPMDGSVQAESVLGMRIISLFRIWMMRGCSRGGWEEQATERSRRTWGLPPRLSSTDCDLLPLVSVASEPRVVPVGGGH